MGFLLRLMILQRLQLSIEIVLKFKFFRRVKGRGFVQRENHKRIKINLKQSILKI